MKSIVIESGFVMGMEEEEAHFQDVTLKMLLFEDSFISIVINLAEKVLHLWSTMVGSTEITTALQPRARRRKY